MKVQCDVCRGEGAVVFCCADEAALCGACDARVHGANKLAGKHRRFSLHDASSPHQFPLCDICREKRAILFCKEDRAILCRDCDGPIHDASDLTKKHGRFLLTGIRLSPSPAAAMAESASSSSNGRPSSLAACSTTAAYSANSNGAPAAGNKNRVSLARCAPKQNETPAAVGKGTAARKVDDSGTLATGFGRCSAAGTVDDEGLCSGSGVVSGAAPSAGNWGSSISEYLMKELPGWHVEDLLLESCPAVHGGATSVESLTPFRQAGLDAAGAAAVAGVTFFPEESATLPVLCGPYVHLLSSATTALPAPLPLHLYDHCQQHRQEAAPMASAGGEFTPLLPSRQIHLQHQHHRRAADHGFTVPDLVATQRGAPPGKRHRPSPWRIS